MPYITLKTGIPEIYQLRQLRTDHPNVSFPKDPSDSVLADYDVYPYTVETPPSFDPLTQALTAGVITQVDGQWTQGWEVIDLGADDAAANVRNRRNELLAETDWTQVADAPVDKAVWATYRQALRDVTDQAGFPYNVTWPTKP